jgi:predicted hydrocarbon binding protein
MVDVEFRVVADRRDGLLLALGQTVIAAGFTLLRQRMVNSEEGVVLTMVVRGPENGLLMLEERLGTHHLVNSFEASAIDASVANTVSAPMPAPAAPKTNGEAPSKPAGASDDAATAMDTRRVESLLPQLARDYPNIFIQLLALEHDLPPPQREATLRYIGQRVGTWVYKRDYALGGHLALADSVRHIALPALRQLVQAELQEDTLRVKNSPFCHRGEHGASCHFLRGMLGGLLGGPHGTEGVRVVESHCRNTGAETCCFEFHA